MVTTIRLICSIALISLFFPPLYGENALPRKMPDGISIALDSSTIQIRVCSPRIFRVSVLPKGVSTLRPSLVVTRGWERTVWSSASTDSSITLSTAFMSARVNLRSGAVTFRRINGDTLVQEDREIPHTMDPIIAGGERAHSIRQRFRLMPGEGIYGLGQFEDGVVNYRNHDIVLVQNNRHICVPFLLSSRNYGIYWDNYSDTRFHDGPDGMSLWSEVGDGIDYYFIAGDNMDGVIAGYREATGRVPMFPKWAFGYWQSKERYENQDDLMSAAREYRRRGIPIDNIVQDWQYWGRLGWNAMAFDDSLFPNPKGMIDSLHNLYHMQFMISIWPQVDSSTAVYRELKAAGHLYPTKIWNGGKTYDPYSKEARDIYWRHLNKGLYSLGVDAWWVDATEPDSAWCDTPLEEKIGIVSNGMTAMGPSTRYLNTFSLMTTSGIYENQRRANPSRRVMMLTRSAFAGQQKNSMAVWSGDISSTWEVFKHQIAGGVNISMAGIPWWNSDIGGFLPKEYGGQYPLGPRDPSFNELYVRWFQFGAFSPIFRAHGTDFPREIWRFGEPGDWAYDALVKFTHLRYRILPYIYSVASRVTSDHFTMMRGLPMDFAQDSTVLNIDNEYMFGPSFLVAPVTQELFFPKLSSIIIPARCLRSKDKLPGLTGSYFTGIAFDRLDHVQRDSIIAFDWTKTGAPGVGSNNFTIRWEGQILAPETGKYQFEVTSNDGVNLWVDGKQIMDEMYPAGRQMNIGEVELVAGSWHDITFEYQQTDKEAMVELAWRLPSMLASYRPVQHPKPVNVYLPGSTSWIDFWTGARHGGGERVEKQTPLDIMPLYVKAGSILPMGPRQQYYNEKTADSLEIRIYPGADGTFTLYEDENDGYGYEMGARALITLRWDDHQRTLNIGKRVGAFPGMLRKRAFRIVLVSPGHGVGESATDASDAVIQYDGAEQRVQLSLN